MNLPNARAFLAALTLFAAAAEADFVRASRDTLVRERADKNSAQVLRLEKGGELTLDRATPDNGFYRVKLDNGRVAFVLTTTVRVFPGSPTPAGGPAAPAAPTHGPGGAALSRAAAAEARSAADKDRFQAFHLKLGEPVALYKRVREAYVTAVDPRLKIPVWVQYQLAKDALDGPASREGIKWEPDDTIAEQGRAADDDYKALPYDRGHMAPAEDMTRSDRVMGESFILSNVVPQWGDGFNGGVWAALEKATRDWVKQRGTLTVIDGPIFDVGAAPAGDTSKWSGQVTYGVVGANHIAVPTHIFKILVDMNDPANPAVMAWVFPNMKLTGEKYTDPKYLTSIDEIENRTGLELLDGLPPDVRTRLKAIKPTQVWPQP